MAAFYDRFLATLPEHAGERVLVGLAYEWQILGELPVAEHDQRVDFLCTEAGFRACSPED